MSLDDYYIDRDKIAPGPDGKLDLEHINTIDCSPVPGRYGVAAGGLGSGASVLQLPYRKTGVAGQAAASGSGFRHYCGGASRSEPRHAAGKRGQKLIFRLYVSPLLPLNLDNHNRIPTSYLRLLRRIVRDYETRGASVQHTLAMWDSVQRGEKRWIFPYQENADVIFQQLHAV